MAFASSLDQIGPIARTVEDLAALLQVVAGFDPKDSTSAPVTPDYSQALGRGMKGIRGGVSAEYLGGGVDRSVRQAVEAKIRRIRQLAR